MTNAIEWIAIANRDGKFSSCYQPNEISQIAEHRTLMGRQPAHVALRCLTVDDKAQPLRV